MVGLTMTERLPSTSHVPPSHPRPLSSVGHSKLNEAKTNSRVQNAKFNKNYVRLREIVKIVMFKFFT